MNLSSGKSELRKFYSSRRKALSREELADCSIRICGRIRELDVYRNTECVAGFFALGAEPDLSSLVPEKRFFLPRYNAASEAYEMVEIRNVESDLVIGRYNIPEPHPELEAADPAWCGANLLYLVPAVACDLAGVRLGRGGGFYDRLLASSRLPKIGVIFSCQIAEKLPCEEHDVRLDMVVTEEVSVVCKPDFK
ncbi:MAG: 5-formyltetrahydrofolate cyclo-ligase [Lentisphaeria bacterium]|nr:5-formyltetrahydrofolate cyclo-ligase [Lentisphaeria bacterium]